MRMSVGIMGGERPSAEILSLRQALLSDPDLRSIDVETAPAASREGAMSSASELLVIAFGAGGMGATVVQALCAWLSGRRRDVRLVVSRGERSVEIDVARARDIDEVVALYRQLEPAPASAADDEARA
ncbi:hypothetical protein ACFW93_39930 [Streptomyces canus]|uniref:effector-associated constant component EACC1 n=1 Tax=Streptomyces canus TaxID=58343 RepID=UPI00367AEE73